MNHDRIQMPNEEEASDITGRYDAVHLAAELYCLRGTIFLFGVWKRLN